MSAILAAVHARAVGLWKREGLLDNHVQVSAGPLTVKQAIGDPGSNDYPIQKGKERLMEAGIEDARGQAFTDDFGSFSGTLREISQLPLNSNFNRAIFVAALNASMRNLERTEHTIHCHDSGPKDCAAQLPAFIRQKYGTPRITQVGFQPAMISALVGEFELRVLDLDPENIGKVRRGALIEGPEQAAEAVEWAELLTVTGTTLGNGTIDEFIDIEGRGITGVPVLFYGTTIAAAASLMGWDRFCPMGG